MPREPHISMSETINIMYVNMYAHRIRDVCTQMSDRLEQTVRTH